MGFENVTSKKNILRVKGDGKPKEDDNVLVENNTEDMMVFSAKELIPAIKKSTRSQMSINLSTEVVNKIKTFTVEKGYENVSAVVEKILSLSLHDQDIDMEKVSQYDEKYKKGKNPKKKKSKKSE